MAEVVLVGGAIGVPALSKNNDVRGAAERIGVDGARAQVDIGVVTRGLVGRGAIEVPDREVFRLVVLLGESLSSLLVICFAVSVVSLSPFLPATGNIG